MATPEVSSIYLRPALNSTGNAGLVTTLAAFSPDIIPLDQVKATPAQLVSTYNSFVAHTIDLDEPSTLVYLRGKQRGSQSIVTLRAVPNELVLWPQVWGSAKIIGQTGFELDETINHNQVAVGVAPIPYTPIRIANQGHSHVTFIATSATPKNAFSAPVVKNWRDLVQGFARNTSLAYYNVQTADCCSRKTTLATKFRLIENESADVELFFGLETTGIPTSGIEASLNVIGKNPDKSGFSFGIDRQPLSQTGVYGKYIKVPSGFEGNVNLEIFNGNLKVFGDYSSVSIVVYAVGSAGDVLLGAEHLVFDSNPRVKKLALSYKADIFSSQDIQPAANNEISTQAVAPRNQGIVSSVFSGITGLVKMPFTSRAPHSEASPPFYFRGSIGFNGVFPRTGNPQSSPDIQPLGTVQDPNPAVTLGDFSQDISSNRRIALVSNTSNYVYLRGTSTTATSGQTRLFYLVGSMFLHPVLYSQPSSVVFDTDPNTGNPVTALRPYQTSGAAQFVITTPFTMDNLPPPSNNGGDHYCLVGEQLTDGQTLWPHEKVSNFATSSEYMTWLLTEPSVCWRNISYVQNPNPDDQTLQTSFEIPTCYASTDQFQFQVQATNCPIGSSFSVTSDDPAILFPDTPVVSNPTIATSAFTGKPPGFKCQVTIHYHSHGLPYMTGQSLVAVLIQIIPLTALVAQIAASADPDPAAVIARNVVTLVGDSYPNVLDPKAPPKDGRLKIGGAIRARAIGEAHDDPFDFVIPILRGVVVGTDRIAF